MRLEPHGISIDRLTTDMGSALRDYGELRRRLTDLENKEEIHKTEIAQGLASIRSLLQRANRAAREVGIIEEDEVAPEEHPANIAPSRDDIIRSARARHGRGNLL